MESPVTCGSCGDEVERVYAVRRKYVDPGAPDRAPSERLVDEVEHWCVPCLTHYPHELVE